MRGWPLILVGLSGCGGDGCGATEPLTARQLRDPEVCAGCHPAHYEEWSGSMHAYAADDPLFDLFDRSEIDDPDDVQLTHDADDPVLLAEQIGTLASLTPGRFIAQCCVGADPAQFRAMGADPRKRGAEFERRFEVLQRLLAGEAAPRGAGERPISISPVPSEPVEYWIGAEAPVAIERAARLADAWLPGPNVPLEEAAAQLTDYLGHCEGHGRTPRATPIRRNIHVAESAEDLEQRVRPALEGAGPGVDPGCVIVGTIDEVADGFAELAAAGFSDVIVRHFLDEPGAVLDSYGRLSDVRKQLEGVGEAST